MASSGTVADPVVHLRFKPKPNREGILLAGKVRMKSQAIIEARDLTLRTIKTFNVTQFMSRNRSGGPDIVYGSVNTPGSLMNMVTVTALRGSIMPHTGTQHVGTIRAGTQQFSFIAVGG